jgi:tRNA G18 (ribose-2'-O)-methylase SpoU
LIAFRLPKLRPAAALPVRGITNSLNVAMTASIVLYELLAS